MVASIDCTHVDNSIGCPVENTIYGYYPNLGANAFFCAAFALSFIAHVFQGMKWKTPFFMWAMAIGTACESVGYGGRIMLHANPYSDPGFKLQIVLLTLSPAFLAAGIYIMLQRLVIVFGERFSLLPPKWYTRIFITCDIISIILQGIGGGISSGATTPKELDAGNNTMIAGVSFQVFTLTVFYILATDWMIRVVRHKHELNPETNEARRTWRFKGSLAAIAISFTGIYGRCIYRVAEMAGGWGNKIMQDEPPFIVLESLFVLIAVAVFNVQHPGYIYAVQRKMAPSPASGVSDEEKAVDAKPKRRFGFGKK